MSVSSLPRGRSSDKAGGDISKSRASRALQRTLKNPIQCTGTALHAGVKVSMTLLPAPPDTGIVFRRTDITGGGAVIPADWRHVVETRLCTTVGLPGGAAVATVEHLMAALAGCEIDNLVVEINGGEVPVMDGSAEPFVFLVECAGIVEQDAPRRGIRVLKPVEVTDGSRRAALLPDDVFRVTFEIEFDSPAVARQRCSFPLVNGVFKSEICRARTFGFLHEVDNLQAAGLAQGGSLDNAVVVSGDRVLNEGGLRYADEFVRHKVLDTIGDLYLAGAPLVGHFRGVQSGHTLNRRLLEALFADDEAWAAVELAPTPAHADEARLPDRPLAATA